MMGVGTFLHHMLDHPRFSILETIGAFMPGEVFPAFFETFFVHKKSKPEEKVGQITVNRTDRYLFYVY